MLDEYPLVADLLADRWVQAGLYILGGGVAALLVQVLFRVVIHRMVRSTASDLDDRIIAVLKGPVFYVVWLIAVSWAIAVLNIPEPYLIWLRSFLNMILFLVILIAAGRVTRMLLQAGSESDSRMRWLDPGSLPLFDNLLKVMLIALGLYLMLSAWNLDVKPWLASAGIAGIAIGFAAKDTLANLFGGMFILADAPYRIGDYIVLGTGERGSVTHIGLRSTRILTRDDVEVTIPNAMIANSTIINESGGPSPKFRVALNVGVSYGADIGLVEEILLGVLAADSPGVAKDPEPRVRFTLFGDSALEFRLLCWVEDPALRGLCLHHLHTLTLVRFREHGVEIPFPSAFYTSRQAIPAGMNHVKIRISMLISAR